MATKKRKLVEKKVETDEVRPKDTFGLTFTENDLKQAKNLHILLTKGEWHCGPNIMMSGTDAIRWFVALIPKMKANIFEVERVIEEEGD